MISLCMLFSLCVGAFELNGYGLHTETLDNLIFSDTFFITEKFPVRSVTTCSLFCWNHVSCMSFSLHKNKEKCRIYATAFYLVEDGTVDQGWKYYAFGSAKCPLRAGFINSRRNKLCINIVTERFLYSGGKQYCLDKGSNLITLETTEKVNAFKNTVSSLKVASSFLIGLRRYNGKWRWEDGTALGSEEDWFDNRPRDNNECAHAVKQWGYRYEDHSCYAYPKYIICEHM